MNSHDKDPYATVILAHCFIEGPTSLVQLIAPALLFPDIASNVPAIMMCRGVGAALFCLSYLAWRIRLMADSPARTATMNGLFIYHILAFLIVSLSKTVFGEAKSMELLSNVVHLGLAWGFRPRAWHRDE